ncbi:MAG: threonine dehydratase [Tagaea sp.]|nr:threonine dehydratase [Tagaea sp.]
MSGFALATIEEAAARVHRAMPPTPQYAWPLLAARLGAEVWVKHENHTPVGAFKVRGGVLHMADLAKAKPGLAGVIAATRGNHGQSIAYGAARAGLKATIVVPLGNSVEKNAAMRAQGAELVEHGHDFQAALEHARALAETRGLHFVGSFLPDLVLGVSTYAYEFFRGAPALSRVYVPIGLGSGICGVIAARDALGLKTEIVGVVAENAPAYALSFEAKKPVSTNTADTLADGMACRVPVEAALETIWKGASRIVRVSEAQLRAAMRAYFSDTHNVAEGAGAGPLAAALAEMPFARGERVGLILSGGNVDRDVFARILLEKDAP